MQIRSIIAAIVLLSGFAAPASAGFWEDLKSGWHPFRGSAGSGNKFELQSAAPIPASTGTVAQGEAAYQKGDYATALRLWRPAAEQDDVNAQFDLGVMYANGRGVVQDYVIAHMWLNLAASKGDKTAAEHRDKIANDMSPAQLAAAQKMAREWKPNQPPPIEAVTDARATSREKRTSKK